MMIVVINSMDSVITRATPRSVEGRLPGKRGDNLGVKIGAILGETEVSNLIYPPSGRGISMARKMTGNVVNLAVFVVR
jgi:hypothetical protein